MSARPLYHPPSQAGSSCTAGASTARSWVGQPIPDQSPRSAPTGRGKSRECVGRARRVNAPAKKIAEAVSKRATLGPPRFQKHQVLYIRPPDTARTRHGGTGGGGTEEPLAEFAQSQSPPTTKPLKRRGTGNPIVWEERSSLSPTPHVVGKALFYLHGGPETHKECRRCPQFRVF